MRGWWRCGEGGWVIQVRSSARWWEVAEVEGAPEMWVFVEIDRGSANQQMRSKAEMLPHGA